MRHLETPGPGADIGKSPVRCPRASNMIIYREKTLVPRGDRLMGRCGMEFTILRLRVGGMVQQGGFV
jgi:hypothetical protein